LRAWPVGTSYSMFKVLSKFYCSTTVKGYFE